VRELDETEVEIISGGGAGNNHSAHFSIMSHIGAGAIAGGFTGAGIGALFGGPVGVVVGTALGFGIGAFGGGLSGYGLSINPEFKYYQ